MIFVNPEFSDKNNLTLSVLAVIFVTIFVIASILGNHGPTLMSNDKCFRFLGCNIGFFGYDAAVHFVSGIMDMTLIVWLMRKFSSLSLFQDRFWKNFLITIAIVALLAFSWELFEFGHDQFRIKILHENITNPNTLDQPTNSDTMGDMTFSLIGAAITASALKSFMKNK